MKRCDDGKKDRLLNLMRVFLGFHKSKSSVNFLKKEAEIIDNEIRWGLLLELGLFIIFLV